MKNRITAETVDTYKDKYAELMLLFRGTELGELCDQSIFEPIPNDFDYKKGYEKLKSNYKLILNSVVLPSWAEIVVKAFPKEEVDKWMIAIKSSMQSNPFLSYKSIKESMKLLSVYLNNDFRLEEIENGVVDFARNNHFDDVIGAYSVAMYSNYQPEVVALLKKGFKDNQYISYNAVLSYLQSIDTEKAKRLRAGKRGFDRNGNMIIEKHITPATALLRQKEGKEFIEVDSLGRMVKYSVVLLEDTPFQKEM